jgi:hypothetical protein
MNNPTMWALIVAIPSGLLALILLVEKAWNPIRRLAQWVTAINQPAPILETVAVPDPLKVATPPISRRRQSHYERVCEVDSAKKWNGRVPPLYPDAVATGPYAERQLAYYRNGTRTR